ncbi:MAG TPA: helix-turn-helix domain-containing protein [Streptosporangiaceae bacterium]|nr:helix-turn-helix domain-containing protein [Streptosporangiaceae bacterium]
MLRDGDGPGLREYLIATAARLIGQRGSAGLAVRDIAREAQVADGVLYNYFEDKEDLLAHALLAHVAAVMQAAPRMPAAGTGSVQDNLRLFIDLGLETLTQVAPAFAGLLSQPGVLGRFHAMVGGDAAFVGGDREGGQGSDPDQGGQASEPDQPEQASKRSGPDEARGLPDILRGYLLAEQRLGRIDEAADVDAAVTLIVGTIHGEILPRVMFAPPGTRVSPPPGLAERVARTVLRGIAPARQKNPWPAPS